MTEALPTQFRDLDTAPIFARGEDPFSAITEACATLDSGEALRVRVHFEPRPLFSVMKSRGFRHISVEVDGGYHIYFVRDQQAEVLDVRGLEPPEPMMNILARLEELGPGAILMVEHHRDPVLLYDKLTERGFVAKSVQKGENYWQISIFPNATCQH